MNQPDPETGTVDHAARILTLNMEFETNKTLSEESVAYLLERAAAAEVWHQYGLLLVQVAGSYRDLAEADIKALEEEVDRLKSENRMLKGEAIDADSKILGLKSEVQSLHEELSALEATSPNG